MDYKKTILLVLENPANDCMSKTSRSLLETMLRNIELNDTYPKEFVQWYSGMGAEKVESAFKRWEEEK